MRTHERFAHVGGWLTALALVCVSLLALAGPTRENRRVRENRRMRGGAPSLFFSAFDTNAIGTSGACSTTAPTGAKGEVLAFTRASNGTCTKTASGGLATTGIADGDLVVLSSNVARVEYDSNGVLGLLVESAGDNKCLSSQEIENAAWIKEGPSAPFEPAVGVNDAGSPDGTQTGDAVHFAATSGTDYSDLYQLWTTGDAGDPTTCSAFVKAVAPMDGGVAVSTTTDICLYDGAAWSCGDCIVPVGSSTRCVKSDAAGSGTTNRYCKIGNNSGQNGGVARAAADVSVWGIQGEPKAYATSYIPTAGAAVTRAADSSLDLAAIALAPPFCMGATITGITGASLGSAERGLLQYNNEWGLGSASNQGRTVRAGVGGVSSGTAGVPSITSSVRYSMSRNTGGEQVTVCTNSSCSAATNLAGATTASGVLEIGRADATFTQTYAEGIISRVVVDLSEERCR